METQLGLIPLCVHPPPLPGCLYIPLYRLNFILPIHFFKSMLKIDVINKTYLGKCLIKKKTGLTWYIIV